MTKVRGPYRKAYIGERINNFVLLNRTNKDYWKVKCDCGNEVIIKRNHLYRRKSCGCEATKTRFLKKSCENVITMIRYNHYKQSASSRKIKWDLSTNQFYELMIQNCRYCGSKPNQLIKSVNHKMLVNGIDRVDNTKGYIITNCVPCCKFCNFAKSNSTLVEFEMWINQLIIFRTDEKNMVYS